MLALSALALPPLLLWLRARARAAAAAAAPQPPPAAATAGSLAARHGFGLAARRHFLLDFSYVHLNHASYGAAPRAVVQAASREMALIEAYPDRFMRREDEGQAAVARAADALAAELLRAPPGTTAFVENATAGVNAVLRSLRLRPGDVILLTDHTYNACRNAALDVAERTGAEIVTHRMALPLRRGGGGAGSYADGLVEDYAATLASIAPGRLAFCLLDHMCVAGELCPALLLSLRSALLTSLPPSLPPPTRPSHAPPAPRAAPAPRRWCCPWRAWCARAARRTAARW